jgi:hypothetical protein
MLVDAFPNEWDTVFFYDMSTRLFKIGLKKRKFGSLTEFGCKESKYTVVYVFTRLLHSRFPFL